jgi:hypothetical protein
VGCCWSQCVPWEDGPKRNLQAAMSCSQGKAAFMMACFAVAITARTMQYRSELTSMSFRSLVSTMLLPSRVLQREEDKLSRM